MVRPRRDRGERPGDGCSARYHDEYGLRFQLGGIHPVGTKNWANLFADGSYIELLGVHDPTLPSAARVGRYLERHGDGLYHWALCTDSIEAVALRTGVALTGGFIDSVDGERQASYRFVSHPDHVPVEERRSRARDIGVEITEGSIEWVEVGAYAETLSAWVGDDVLDIRISPLTRGVQQVGFAR